MPPLSICFSEVTFATAFKIQYTICMSSFKCFVAAASNYPLVFIGLHNKLLLHFLVTEQDAFVCLADLNFDRPVRESECCQASEHWVNERCHCR